MNYDEIEAELDAAHAALRPAYDAQRAAEARYQSARRAVDDYRIRAESYNSHADFN